MLEAFARVLAYLGIGEVVACLGPLPVPAPVIGLLILLAECCLRGDVAEEMGRLADGLLRVLGLLFVPAGVGVIAHAGLLRDDALPIVAAIVLGTAVTLASTALAASWLSRAPRQAGIAQPEEARDAHA